MKQTKIISLDELFETIDIHSKKNISFHHHLRNGDFVLNMVLDYYIKEKVSDLVLHTSAIFPSYHTVEKLVRNKQVRQIITNYLNGPVAKAINEVPLKDGLTMCTHGGRARAILEGKDHIDVAFLAVPSCDKLGNARGDIGSTKCGSLGYAVPDSIMADTVVLITDNLVEHIENGQIKGANVDYIIQVDKIGDASGIVSGTTSITSNPIGVKIAKNAALLIQESPYFKQGFSFQSGAGGVSLKVTDQLKKVMEEKEIKASFFSGGITKYHVAMLEKGLVDKLYDVQCFDLEAIESIYRNENHIAIDANDYANPMNPNRVIKDLDIVILGATEVDLDFNCNVITDSHGQVIGGSGGHSDTASDAKLTIIVTPLIKSRIPIIKNRVTTITTLGKHIDAIVTERGIAINPLRQDLIGHFSTSSLPILSIEELQAKAHAYTNIPKNTLKRDIIIGEVRDRTFDIIDYIYKQ
jgi:citrate lyase subunit alpha/citrate CoA-transferase